VLLVALVVVIALGEGMPNVLDLPGTVQIQFLAMAIMVCGFMVGWHWEAIGGFTALAGFAMFCGVELAVNGTLPGGALFLLCIPAILLLMSRWIAGHFHGEQSAHNPK
jgi:hypothetical protein